jgi:large subunit ribosomal protein L24
MMIKRKIRKGDTVKVISGSDRGHVGEVLEVLPTEGKLRVEGARIQKKHIKPGRSALHPDGGIVERVGLMDISNVMFYTEELGTVRIGRQHAEDGKRQRVARGSKHGGAVID